MDRLFERIAGQHSEQDRHAGAQTRIHQGDAHGAIDVLIVRRLAANHGAQAHHGQHTAGCRPADRRPAEFERAGHPGHVDRIVRARRAP